MEILQTRILASASKNYNKAEVEMVVANATAEDMDYIENLCVQEAVNTLNKVCVSNPSEANQAPAKVQTQRIPQIPRAPQPPVIRPSMVSEKQRKVLTKAGYSAEQIDRMTSKEAAKAIEEYWTRTGYNKPQAPVVPQPAYQPEYPDDSYYGYDE